MQTPLTRRQLLQTAAAALSAPDRLRVVVTGGHPGDPECGCAGVMARYADAGHSVAVLYLNRGEGYCGKADLAACASIRTAEAEKACAILRARPLFAGQLDGNAVVDAPHYQAFSKQLLAEKPDVVFTQWPVDRHPDHRAIAALVLNAWLAAARSFALYYYEVAEDTMLFAPAEYVDISGVEARRRAACFAHASQQPEKWYPGQVAITQARGRAAGFAQAEAFLRHPESRPGLLP